MKIRNTKEYKIRRFVFAIITVIFAIIGTVSLVIFLYMASKPHIYNHSEDAKDVLITMIVSFLLPIISTEILSVKQIFRSMFFKDL